MSREGFGATNKCIEERDRARRELEAALRYNRELRGVLIEVRRFLITRKQKHLIDGVLNR